MNKVIVTAINLFPVRSCAGQSLQEAAITPHGLVFDRQWRLVSAAGRFLTQRECPKMALIKPSVQDGQLLLSFGDDPEPSPALVDSHTVAVYEKWQGRDQGDAVAAWLELKLGTSARLLRVSDEAQSEDFARPDMSPVLVISEESLADLNSRMSEPVLMNRFRPNIVIAGGAAYAEEDWTRVQIGDVVYVASTEPCGRCSLINIDQEKGERSGNPLKTLATYRRVPGAVIFGKYMVPENSGTVRVGAEVAFKN